MAASSGRDPNTVGRVLKGEYDPQLGTARRMSEALLAEELRLRDYLLTLHPVAPATIAVPA